MCVCQFYSHYLCCFRSPCMDSTKSKKNKKWNWDVVFSYICYKLFFVVPLHLVVPVFGMHALFDNFWSCNQNSKTVKENALKSMGNHFVWYFLKLPLILLCFFILLSFRFIPFLPFCTVVMFTSGSFSLSDFLNIFHFDKIFFTSIK